MKEKCSVDKCEDTDGYYINSVRYCGKHAMQIKRCGEILERTRFDPNEIVIYDTYAEIILYNKENKECGRTAIDLEDVDRCKKYKWFMKDESGRQYAISRIDGKGTRLHRYILNFYDYELDVDHKNGNGLDNRKTNLSIVTRQQNMMNQRKVPSNNTSGVIGITQDKKSKNWVAQIKYNGKRIYLKTFKNIEDAILARKQAELKYFGEYKLANFE